MQVHLLFAMRWQLKDTFTHAVMFTELVIISKTRRVYDNRRWSTLHSNQVSYTGNKGERLSLCKQVHVGMWSSRLRGVTAACPDSAKACYLTGYSCWNGLPQRQHIEIKGLELRGERRVLVRVSCSSVAGYGYQRRPPMPVELLSEISCAAVVWIRPSSTEACRFERISKLDKCIWYSWDRQMLVLVFAKWHN